MLLSAVLHAVPMIGLPWVAHSCGGEAPSPSVPEVPFGVSLVYAEELAKSAKESGFRGDTGATGDRSATGVDARRSLQASRDASIQRQNEAPGNTAETGVAAKIRPVVGDNAPVQVYTTVADTGVTPRPRPVEPRWQQSAAVADLRWSPQRPAAKRGGVTAASGRPGSSSAQQDRERAIQMIKRRIEKVMPFVYWSSRLRDQVAGSARVRFRLSRRGYVHELQVIEVTGELELREATSAALHLAEPYVYVPGWIELHLVFRG